MPRQLNEKSVIFIVAPCILKIHLLSHSNECTNYIIYYLKSVLIVDIKTLSYFHSSYMFRHITCHHQGAIMFLAKITGKTMCKTWTYTVWSGTHGMPILPGSPAMREVLLLAAMWILYSMQQMVCCHTLHTIYVHVLQIVLPVILARNMSAPWGWHVIWRNM
jgi:hypothetical protein